MRNQLEITKKLYFQIWEKALAAFFGWDRTKVADWAKQWETEMNDLNSWFFHEDPSYYLVPLLIADTLKQTFSNDMKRELDNELCTLLSQGIDLRWTAVHYDWQAAKHRVAKLLKQYGTSLPKR